MATVAIAAGKAEGSRPGVPMVLVAGSVRARQAITSSANNQVSTVIGRSGETVTICSSGGPVKVAIAVGANPDATSAYDYIVSDGGIMPLFCNQNDTRFAVVNA